MKYKNILSLNQPLFSSIFINFLFAFFFMRALFVCGLKHKNCKFQILQMHYDVNVITTIQALINKYWDGKNV